MQPDSFLFGKPCAGKGFAEAGRGIYIEDAVLEAGLGCRG